MKLLISAAFATLLIAAPAEAITKARFILKSTGGTEVAQKISGKSLGNCLSLDAVVVARDTIAVAIDCDTVAYAVKAVSDIMAEVEGAGELMTIGFDDN